MPHKCFLIERTERVRLSLRRYTPSAEGKDRCPRHPGHYSYHDAMLPGIAVVPDAEEFNLYRPPQDDPRWPRACACGYQFAEEDVWQLFNETVWKRADNGEETTIRDAAPGALWYADWYGCDVAEGQPKKWLTWEWDNQLAPVLFMLKLLKVARPLTTVAVIVPDIVPPEGFVPIASVTCVLLSVVTTLLSTS